MIMMGKHESFVVDKDSAEGKISLETLAMRLAQSKGLKLDGTYQYNVHIIGDYLYWVVDKVADGTE